MQNKLDSQTNYTLGGFKIRLSSRTGQLLIEACESPIDWHSGAVYTEYRRIGNGPDTVAYLKEVAEDDLSILLKGNTP